MYKLSKDSLVKLSELDSRLQDILNAAIKVVDFAITTGHRGEKEQNEAFDKGFSKLKYPASKHNKKPSKAVDIAPYPIDYKDHSRFYYLAGVIMSIADYKGINIRWGNDWDKDNDFKDNKINDLPHFELVE